jgi:lipid-A-disaccharide synthase-like uncharacterized protein
VLRQVTFTIVVLGFVLVVWVEPACAQNGSNGFLANVAEHFSRLIRGFREEVTNPLFWFGMGAQALFFARFLVQWIVSERHQRSTVPTAFWYLSLSGGLSLFVYAFLRGDPVIMLGQLLACAIYTRNLMLIYKHAANRRRSGLPPAALESVTNGDEPDPPA